MKTKLKTLIVKLLTSPLLIRVFHTFWQAFLTVFTFGWLNVLHAFQNGGLPAGEAALLALLGAALAAGFSAIRSIVAAWIKKVTSMA